MIQNLQKQLVEIYSLPHSEDITNFLIDEKDLLKYQNEETLDPHVNEQILVQCNEDRSIFIGLYFRDEVLKNLHRNRPDVDLDQENLKDFCTLIEGISHFLYVSFCNQFAFHTSILELELQAEIDKFVTCFIYQYHQVGTTRCADDLHQAIFRNYQFRPNLDKDEKERYRFASQGAAKVCRHLTNKYIKHQLDWMGLLAFLRRFYRLGWNEKFTTISRS